MPSRDEQARKILKHGCPSGRVLGRAVAPFQPRRSRAGGLGEPCSRSINGEPGNLALEVGTSGELSASSLARIASDGSSGLGGRFGSSTGTLPAPGGDDRLDAHVGGVVARGKHDVTRIATDRNICHFCLPRQAVERCVGLDDAAVVLCIETRSDVVERIDGLVEPWRQLAERPGQLRAVDQHEAAHLHPKEASDPLRSDAARSGEHGE